MDSKTLSKLQEVIDSLEDEFGELEGIEISLDHPILEDGLKQGFASIKELHLVYKIRQKIELNGE